MNEREEQRESLERLVALGRTPEVNIRPVLLRVLIDLFVRRAHHPPAELAQFEEIAQRLLGEADADTRMIVAGKLCRHPATPGSLLRRFLAEGGAAASLVLEHARVDRETLLAAAAWGSSEMAVAVARRADLDPAVARSLSERSEREVALALATNPLAQLDRPSVRALVQRAKRDAELARAVLGRACEPVDLAPLFLQATGEQRAAILLSAHRDDFGPTGRRVRPSAEEAAALSRLERSLVADHDGFDAALAAALKIRLADAWCIIDDRRGEPLAVALAAVGASPEFAARVFILSGPAIGHSVMAVRNLISIVETLPIGTARQLIAAMTDTPAKPSRKPTPVAAETTAKRRHAGSESQSAQVAPAPAALPRRASSARNLR